MIAPNTIIGGRYKVLHGLGGGGMKQVYLAEDLRLASRPCALAEMVDSFTKPEMQKAAVASFQREADMLAELSHEHIPRIFDRFSDQNRHYLVMEYVDGKTLEELLKENGGKLGEREVVDMALQVLDTLEYLHGRNPPVIYRDLKPSNVMMTSTEQLKLVDFGIARHFQPQSNATMIGTQGYAPPEQYRGKVETRSDIYALGATMHHALSGRDPTTEPPFSFPALEKLCPDIRPALAAVVNEALSYDVAGRIPSVFEFKRRLLSIKIEALTHGLVANEDVAAALGTGSSRAKRPQLKLPLSQPPPPASPSAPTLLTDAEEVPCTGCGRYLTPDSRFCSYCGSDLRQPFSVSQTIAPEAETIQLPPISTGGGRNRYSPSHTETWHRRRRRGIPLLVLLFFAGFLAFRLVPFLEAVVAELNGTSPSSARDFEGTDPGYAERFGEPPERAPSPRSGGGAEPLHQSTRAVALRRMLNQMGYPQVHFRLNGERIELWGTVGSEADRLMAETTAFSVTGAASLDDHIQIEESLAEP